MPSSTWAERKGLRFQVFDDLGDGIVQACFGIDTSLRHFKATRAEVQEAVKHALTHRCRNFQEAKTFLFKCLKEEFSTNDNDD